MNLNFDEKRAEFFHGNNMNLKLNQFAGQGIVFEQRKMEYLYLLAGRQIDSMYQFEELTKSPKFVATRITNG
jgi:hypothetical protein